MQNPSGYYNGYYENPYFCVDTNRDSDWTSRLTANVQASWDILWLPEFNSQDSC